MSDPKHANTFAFCCFVERLPTCCGVNEVGDFRLIPPKEYRLNFYTQADTEEEVYKKAFNRLLKDQVGECSQLQAWFVKHVCESSYEHEPLLTLFSKHPKSLFLGEFKNPNSQNTICGYAIEIDNTQWFIDNEGNDRYWDEDE